MEATRLICSRIKNIFDNYLLICWAKLCRLKRPNRLALITLDCIFLLLTCIKIHIILGPETFPFFLLTRIGVNETILAFTTAWQSIAKVSLLLTQLFLGKRIRITILIHVSYKGIINRRSGLEQRYKYSIYLNLVLVLKKLTHDHVIFIQV